MVATIVISVVIAAIVVTGMLRYRKSLRSGCCGSDGDAAPKRLTVRDRDVTHYPCAKVLEINGMTCTNCATHVQNALNSLDGVYAKVDLGSHRAVVRMKNELPDALLRKTVVGSGYTVKTIREPQGAQRHGRFSSG